MDGFISSYTSLSTQAVTGIQHLGLLSLPLGIAVIALVNFFGGDKAIRAAGFGIAVLAILNIVLSNAMALSNWIASLPHG